MSKRKGNPNTRDIKSYFTQTAPKHREMESEKGGGSSLPGEEKNQKRMIKSEDNSKEEEGHSHKFLLKFDQREEKTQIHCDRPQTVLDAILSREELKAKIKPAHDQIILQTGEIKKKTAIATHFPCSLLKDEELVTLFQKEETVERKDPLRINTTDQKSYHAYILTEGGKNAKCKPLFESSTMKEFTQLCVYGTGNMTLKEAIARDGRFLSIEQFKFEDLDKGSTTVSMTDKIKAHDRKTFKIWCERGIQATKCAAKSDTGADGGKKATIKTEGPSDEAGGGGDDEGRAGPSSAGAENKIAQAWIPLSEAVKTKLSVDLDEIYKRLREQFPELRAQLKERFPSQTFKETLKKVDFGKAQSTFSKVSLIKDLLEKGKSVCKIIVGNVCTGTGFVLFKHFILTNAHLFEECQPHVRLAAMFDYEKDEQNAHTYIVRRIVFSNEEMDYAVLEVVVSEDGGNMPPGLMKHCSVVPLSREACIIGHPNGGEKQFDATSIIQPENRPNEIKANLQEYENYEIAHMSVFEQIANQHIERILTPSNPLYKTLVTYNTFMYHGSSGSPVFDAHCGVFALHSGGFVYDFLTKKGSIIEFARPLVTILQDFVAKVRTSGEPDLLEAVKEELRDNEYRAMILNECESMDTN